MCLAERATSTTVIVALLVVVAACTERAQDAEPARIAAHDQAAIEALIEETAAANNAGDVERWVALFHDDFVYMASGSPAVTTREELSEVARAGFRNDASIDIEPAEIQVFPDWAFARSEVSGRVEVAGTGEVVPVNVKQLVIYRRDPGTDEWRIARMISNSNTY